MLFFVHFAHMDPSSKPTHHMFVAENGTHHPVDSFSSHFGASGLQVYYEV